MKSSSTRSGGRSAVALPRYGAGFSMFELVVFIISVAIIYAYAANRFAEFPGQAERANFLAITTQIQSAINMEMMIALGEGRRSAPALLEGANPMELLLEPPANYMGTYDLVDLERLPRRSWYFDRPRGELVYLVNDANGVFLIQDGVESPTDEIRFRIVANYSDFDLDSGLSVAAVESGGGSVASERREARFTGIVMRSVIPYGWGEASPAALLAAAEGNNPG